MRSSDYVKQLAMFADVSEGLERAEVPYWMFGGWAVDFYVGRVTRPHEDIDLAVWLAHVPVIRGVLEDQGWVHEPEPDEDGGTGFVRNGVRLELTFLDRDGHGVTCIPLRNGPVAWTPGQATVREMEGVRVTLIGFEELLQGKSSFRDDPKDAAKDRADHGHLKAAGNHS